MATGVSVRSGGHDCALKSVGDIGGESGIWARSDHASPVVTARPRHGWRRSAASAAVTATHVADGHGPCGAASAARWLSVVARGGGAGSTRDYRWRWRQRGRYVEPQQPSATGEQRWGRGSCRPWRRLGKCMRGRTAAVGGAPVPSAREAFWQ